MDMSAALNRIEEEIRKSPYHRGVFDSSCEGGKLNPRTEGHGGRRGGRGQGHTGWRLWSGSPGRNGGSASRLGGGCGLLILEA
jgi:hypothetical protein